MPLSTDLRQPRTAPGLSSDKSNELKKAPHYSLPFCSSLLILLDCDMSSTVAELRVIRQHVHMHASAFVRIPFIPNLR